MIEDPELLALGKTLKQAFVMHIRASPESIMSYRLLDAAGRGVGHKTVYTVNKTGKVTVCYALGDARFDGAEAFLKAYRQQLRDEEFESAAPKEKSA